MLTWSYNYVEVAVVSIRQIKLDIDAICTEHGLRPIVKDSKAFLSLKIEQLVSRLQVMETVL